MLILTVPLILSCSREVAPGLSDQSSRQVIYDVTKDPLVNPPQLFEPLPEDDPEAASTDATLIRLTGSSPTNLNPIFNNLWVDHHVRVLLFTSPFRRLASMETVVNDDMVESYEESEDHLEFTIHLKPGMTWHDGEPVTAHDIRFTWEAITDDNVPSSFWRTMGEKLSDVRVLDDLTVQYVHKEAIATQMMNMSFPLIPKHIFDNPEERAKDPSLKMSPYYNHYAREEIIGNGPYRFVEWTTNDRIVVERWEDYTLTKPRFKRQILKIQPDPNVALLLFKAGELHETGLSPLQFATQTNDPAFERVGVKGYGLQRMVAFVGWNHDGSNPFFSDALVRKAMAHVFDVKRVLRDATYNLYTPSTGIFDSEDWAYNPDIEPIPFERKAAEKLLDEAGWLVSDDDGWRYKEIGGVPVKFEFEMIVGQGFTTAHKTINIFTEDLRRIGVSMKQRIFETATLVSMLEHHEFQAYFGVIEVTTDPDLWTHRFTTDSIDRGMNYGSYSNARVDELFDLARKQLGREERAPYYREIQAILYEDQTFLFAWNYSMLWAVNKRMRGVEFAPSGVYLFYPSWTNWWFAKEDASSN